MKKVGKVLLLVVCALFVALIDYTMMGEAKDVRDYIRTKDTKVELTAKITGATEGTKTDDDTYWSLTVSYTYEGKTYSGVYYGQTDFRPELGKSVKVAIDPENPGELLPTGFEFWSVLLLGPVFLTGATIGGFIIILLLIRALELEWNAAAVACILMACRLVAESYFSYRDTGSWTFAAFSMVAVVACLIIEKLWKSGGSSDKSAEEPA